MDTDKWLTLPDDVLVDIFQRLKTIAVIRCAAACRPWRRTIIDNAWCLWLRPDRFLPDVLLGFLDKHSGFPRLMQYVPAVWVDGSLYNNLLSSRDGFLLLGEDKVGENLCLWTALTGICRVLPAAAFECIYVLATGYDVSGNGDDTAVWILAVEWQRDAKDGTTYQIFSSTSGAWGPVKRSAKFPEDVAHVYCNPCDVSESMVFRGTVSWFLGLVPDCDVVNGIPRIVSILFSVDLSTERTWTTDLPSTGPVVLAVSEDRQLSLVDVLYFSRQMEVWVLVGNGQWTLRRTVDMQKLFPICRTLRLSGFCPRSGYLFGKGMDDQGLQQLFLIGVDGSSPRLIGTVESGSSALITFPYEMDFSAYILSYISKMKYF